MLNSLHFGTEGKEFLKNVSFLATLGPLRVPNFLEHGWPKKHANMDGESGLIHLVANARDPEYLGLGDCSP